MYILAPLFIMFIAKMHYGTLYGAYLRLLFLMKMPLGLDFKEENKNKQQISQTDMLSIFMRNGIKFIWNNLLMGYNFDVML